MSSDVLYQMIVALHAEGATFTPEVKCCLTKISGRHTTVVHSIIRTVRLTGIIEDTIFASVLTRKRVIERDNSTCQYCGVQGGNIIAEHVVPSWWGGPGRPFNLVAACASCNCKKGANVWIPRNLDAITSDAPDWREVILDLAANGPRLVTRKPVPPPRPWERDGKVIDGFFTHVELKLIESVAGGDVRAFIHDAAIDRARLFVDAQEGAICN